MDAFQPRSVLRSPVALQRWEQGQFLELLIAPNRQQTFQISLKFYYQVKMLMILERDAGKYFKVAGGIHNSLGKV